MSNPHRKAPEGSRAIDWERERLNAAAPALLEALSAVVSDIRKFHGDFDAKLFVQAERAIAQAKGERE